MNSSQLPFEIPKRSFLAAQSADSIRKAIEEGTWREYLPSERRLCVVSDRASTGSGEKRKQVEW